VNERAKQSVVVSHFPDLKEQRVTVQIEPASNSPTVFPENESCSLTGV
jgi:hypothetical protein